MNKSIDITLDRVSFAYSEESVISNMSLEIEKGSFVCITGESGCGKSTLLRLMNGLLLPQEGKIKIENRYLMPTNLVDIRRKMGYILQEGSLFPHLTAYQNMSYCLDLIGMSEMQKKERILALLPLMNLDKSLLEKYPHELSGGQSQRVGIIRGIAHKPSIVLMDEPFSALDPETRESLQNLVKSIHQKTQTTFVMVTHSPSEAEKLGTQIIKMS